MALLTPASPDAPSHGVTSAPLLRRYLPLPLAQPLARIIDNLSGLTDVRDIHARTRSIMADSGLNFADAALKALSLNVCVDRHDLERVPRRGPLVVVANHPFGGIEGVVLASLLGKVRSDVKILGNHLLHHFPELSPQLISVDVFSDGPSPLNTSGLRNAVRHLRDGGCLIVFPAGTVSHFHPSTLQIADPDWERGVELIVRRAGASVLPVFIPGANGPVFQLLGLLHPVLRTIQLPRATARRRGTSMTLRIGAHLTTRHIADIPEGSLSQELRSRVYLLRHRPPSPNKTLHSAPVELSTHVEPVIPETSPSVLAREIAALPADSLLVDGNEYQAFLARPGQIPHILREIGRLREITFRAVGEGTGKSCDLDPFDQHYLHLFVWHRTDQRLVGAYRLGRVDLILQAKGLSGLYTSTLFDFPERLLHRIGGALEVGRSFIRAEYQRSHLPLLTLWKGIGAFVSRNPAYHTLFGPVSISATYASITRSMMVRFLSLSGLRADGAEWVRARSPFRMRRYAGLDESLIARMAADPETASHWISHLEPDAKGLPILLAHYLKLGARVLAFNVDHDFGGCLDALITVDLRRSEPRLLSRYMGRLAAQEFLRSHATPHSNTLLSADADSPADAAASIPA